MKTTKQENKWETLSIAENREELKKEIDTLKNMQETAKEILKEEHEVKLAELNKAIEKGMKKIKEIQNLGIKN